MANVKITELTALTDPASTDVLPIVDVVADITKKISIADLLENAGSGTAAAPGIAFDGDSNTGIYRPGADQLAISTSGTQRLVVDSTGQIEAKSLGSASAPTWSFVDDPNTGIYSPGANQLALATNGTERVEFGTSEVVFNDGGANYDFRIEGNAKANLLFVDASADQVGVGTNANGSNARFEIKSTTGSINSATLRLNSSDTTTGAVDTGSTLLLSGHDGSVSGRDFASVFAAKENSTSGNYASYLAFGTRANGGAVGERLRITSDGKVGVGTSSPDQLLHLSNSSGPVIRIENTDTTLTTNNLIGGVEFETQDATSPGVGVTGGIRMYAADTFGGQSYMTFSTTNGSSKDNEVMRISNVGSVGIGTTSPSGLLHLKGGGIRIQSDDNTDEKFIDFRNAADSSTRGFVAYNFSDDALKFRAGGSGENMRIDSSGRLLVGTSSYSGNATIVAQGYAGSSTGPAHFLLKSGTTTPGSSGFSNDLGYLFFSDGTTSGGFGAWILGQRDGGTWTSGSSMPGRLVFSTTADGASSPTERMRITSGGWTQFSSGISLDGAPKSLNTSSFGSRFGISSAGAELEGFIISFRDVDGTEEVANFGGNAGEVNIYGDGDLENTNNSYTGISDIKLKENIVDANSQWDDLKSLQVRNYNFKAETGYNTHTQIGLIAQEVELISPGLVGESIDEETGESTKSVNYSVLYMKAVKALQEAMERIETLEAKVAALEAS